MHRCDDGATQVVVQKDSVRATTGRDAPERFDAAGVLLGIGDALGFFRCQVHRLEDVSNSGQVEIGIGESRAQLGEEVRELNGLLASHTYSFPGRCQRVCWALRISAARSPMMTQGAMVFPVVTRGTIDPSAMRRCCIH